MQVFSIYIKRIALEETLDPYYAPFKSRKSLFVR